MGIYEHEELVEGVGEIKFLRIPMIELSPIYRQVASMIFSAGMAVDGLDSDLTQVISIIADERIDKIRDTFFNYMVLNEVKLSAQYEKLLSEKGAFLEIPLFALAVKVYLGKHLRLALKSDSALRQAVASLFPQVESILTGFSGSQLSEKLQDFTK